MSSGLWRNTIRKGTSVIRSIQLGESTTPGVHTIDVPWVFGVGASCTITLSPTTGTGLPFVASTENGMITLDNTDGTAQVNIPPSATDADDVLPAGNYSMVLLITFGSGGTFSAGTIKDPLAGPWTVQPKRGV